jgi:hypothetical protein
MKFPKTNALKSIEMFQEVVKNELLNIIVGSKLNIRSMKFPKRKNSHIGRSLGVKASVGWFFKNLQSEF